MQITPSRTSKSLTNVFPILINKSLNAVVGTEKREFQRRQEKEDCAQVLCRLYTSSRRWYYGLCQFCKPCISLLQEYVIRKSVTIGSLALLSL